MGLSLTTSVYLSGETLGYDIAYYISAVIFKGRLDPESGFEPLLMESESIVLPLNYSGPGMKILCGPYIIIFLMASRIFFGFFGWYCAHKHYIKNRDPLINGGIII